MTILSAHLNNRKLYKCFHIQLLLAYHANVCRRKIQSQEVKKMYDLKLMYEVGKLRMREFRETGMKGGILESGTTERIATPPVCGVRCTS